MRRILGRGDTGDDVALIQETINDLMPFTGPAARIPNVGTIWEQEAEWRATLVGAAACPLHGVFDIPSWGTVHDWGDLNYTWSYGALTAARNRDGDVPLPKLTGDLEPHNYQRIDADGDYGPTTEGVVKQFQRLSGLPADGIFGPATWQALMPTDIFSVLLPKQQDNTAKPGTVMWQKLDDKHGCYRPIPGKPGVEPPPGYKAVTSDDDDDDKKASVKVEVQSGIQTGDARYWVLGQIIFVRPKGEGPLGFLPGHTEIAVGSQVNIGNNVQIFVSVTQADLIKVTGKYVEFSVDTMVQPYVQVMTSKKGAGVAVQGGPVVNLSLTPLLEKIIGHKTDWEVGIYGQGVVQGGYGVDLPFAAQGGIKISRKLPW